MGKKKKKIIFINRTIDKPFAVCSGIGENAVIVIVRFILYYYLVIFIIRKKK